MKGYEVLFIINVGIGEDKIKKVISDFESVITKNDGSIIATVATGRKELATEFDKQREGYYVQCQFNASNDTLDQLNHFFQVTETVLRHLTVTLDSVKPLEVAEA